MGTRYELHSVRKGSVKLIDRSEFTNVVSLVLPLNGIEIQLVIWH